MEPSSTKRYTILIYLGLITATLVAYEPIRHNNFISYDDPHYITENTRITGPITWESVRWAFTSFDAANWHPLTWLSHMLDYQIFGLNPRGHHLVNLLFHLASTLLLFGLLKSMTKAIWPSLIVAAAFALHPLHVESVAWAAERKDVLSTFFWMLTMAAYVRYARTPSIGKYILVIVIFALGLTAKPMLVTLPFVLLLLDCWPLRRFQGLAMPAKALPQSPSSDERFAQTTLPRLILEKLPLLALVIASCIVTYLAQQSIGAVESVEHLSIKCRMGNALVSYVGYINKMVYPDNLAIIYPLQLKLPETQQLIFCLVELIAISAAALYFRRQGYLLMGWLWYLGTLIPVIGLVQVGSTAMADRYTYMSLRLVFLS